MLDLGTAAVLDIIAPALPPAQVTTAGGQAVNFRSHDGVALTFAGTTVTPTVLFGVVAVPLLGRSALFHAIHGVKIGFDSLNWLHT